MRFLVATCAFLLVLLSCVAFFWQSGHLESLQAVHSTKHGSRANVANLDDELPASHTVLRDAQKPRTTALAKDATSPKKGLRSYYSSPSYNAYLKQTKQRPSPDTFFKHHSDPTMMLVQTNSANLPFVLNQICSLSRFDAPSLSSLVIWALDEAAVEKLEMLRKQPHEDDEWGSTLPLDNKFGLFYERQFKSTEEEVRGGKNLQYKRMMQFRPQFWLDLLTKHKLDFINMDSDIVFYSDPIEAFDTPKDVDGPYALEPDISYSTDGRSLFEFDEDPYRLGTKGGMAKVPPVCAGFFHAKANDRTIKLFDRLVKNKGNDQYGIDSIFRKEEIDSVLVDPLPNGLRRSYQPTDVTDQVRVRILDQTHFVNGALFAKTGAGRPTRKSGRHIYYEKWKALHDAGDGPKMIHANWPSWHKDKMAGMKRFGLWFLDDEMRCTRAVPQF